ncbi:MAG: signal peptidase II [Patescibacteria group bacterium]
MGIFQRAWKTRVWWWGGVLMLLDRIIKYLFVDQYVDKFDVFSWLRLELRLNDGLAFGLLSGHGLIISLLGIIIFLYFLWRYHDFFSQSVLSQIGVSLVLGGALSNLWDRFVYNGYVIDYINLTFYSVFNLADVGIVIGLLVMTVFLLSNQSSGE